MVAEETDGFNLSWLAAECRLRMMNTASATFEGQVFNAKIPELGDEARLQMSATTLTREQLTKRINALDISADAKLLLSRVSAVVVQVGEAMIAVGRRILEIALFVAHEFPMAGVGLILGVLLGALVGAIPLLGAILGPLITPIAAALGLFKGATEDLRDKSLKRRIDEAVALYEPLRGDVHVAQ